MCVVFSATDRFIIAGQESLVLSLKEPVFSPLKDSINLRGGCV